MVIDTAPKRTKEKEKYLMKLKNLKKKTGLFFGIVLEFIIFDKKHIE